MEVLHTLPSHEYPRQVIPMLTGITRRHAHPILLLLLLFAASSGPLVSRKARFSFQLR